MNFQQTWLYWLAGAVLLVVAVMSWRDKANPRRLTTGLFWGLYGLVDQAFRHEGLIRDNDLFTVKIGDRRGANADFADGTGEGTNGHRIANAHRALKENNQTGNKVTEDLL